MGNHYIIKEETLINIADNIREKLGTEDSYSPDDMASGVNEVYEAGKEKEWSDFWEGYQWGGTRTNYTYAFYYWEGTEYIRPKYKVVPTSTLYNMFAVCRNLKKIEAEYFDLSQANVTSATNSTGLNNVFYACRSLEEIEDIGLKAGGYNMTFNGCNALRKIAKLRATEDCQFISVFTTCTSLADITFEGVIGQNISFSHSPLTVESMKGIITHLKNYAGTDSEGTYTLTLKDTCKTALQDDTETVELDGVSYTYFELITAKGWNLA